MALRTAVARISPQVPQQWATVMRVGGVKREERQLPAGAVVEETRLKNEHSFSVDEVRVSIMGRFPSPCGDRTVSGPTGSPARLSPIAAATPAVLPSPLGRRALSRPPSRCPKAN